MVTQMKLLNILSVLQHFFRFDVRDWLVMSEYLKMSVLIKKAVKVNTNF